MICLVWNCHGLGRPAKIQSLRGYIRSHRPAIIFISKVKFSNFDCANHLALSLHFSKFHFVLSRGNSGGLLLLWKEEFNIEMVASIDSLINYVVLGDESAQSNIWQFIFVYGPPIPSLRPAFWENLINIRKAFDGPWITAGDFNVVLSQADKASSRLIAHSSRNGFQRMINQNGFIDLGYKGHAFTWNNKRIGKANICERLDRGFSNSQWRLIFPKATLSHLTVGPSSASHQHLPSRIVPTTTI